MLKNFIDGDRDALELSFSVLTKVKSPKTKLSLELFKSYSLLILILSFS